MAWRYLHLVASATNQRHFAKKYLFPAYRCCARTAAILLVSLTRPYLIWAYTSRRLTAIKNQSKLTNASVEGNRETLLDLNL